ncbi:MAG: hypothetical protein SPE59_07650 [Treponema sp.]|nr:hypothetical protein [Treponema sp.]
MKKTFCCIYSIFAVLVFVFSISFFSYNIFTEYKTGYERTRRRFEHLSNTTKTISNETNSNLLNSRLVKAVGNENDFSYLSFEKNEKLIFSVNPENSQSQSKLIKSFEEKFISADNQFILKANLYIIRPSVIYYYARISFLIVLFITIVTLILILVIKNPKTESVNNPDEKPNSDPLSFDTQASETSEEIIDEKKENIDEISEEQDDTDKTSSNLHEEETNSKVNLPNEYVKPLEILHDDSYDANPAGLFSPLTGFGWESYLLTRLNSELNRAIASEFDLSLFIFKFPDISRTDDKINTICDYLLSHFQFKDLLFEYKEDCLVAIKISTSIDGAIEIADTIYKSITDFIKESRCYIGISSRTIRMINGERLLNEAENALKIAQEDVSTPIVAFRADAEKFRRFEESK